MKVTFLAAPLTARSGVYRSARELVAEGRARGHDWHLHLGVSRSASGDAPATDPEWVSEIPAEPGGLRGVKRLSTQLLRTPSVTTSDLVVSLVPQSDMALALTNLPWIAYTRGLPWPASGEANSSKALVWRTLERIALKRARAVWATTEVLKRDLALGDGVRLVPAGIRPIPREWDGTGARRTAVWAARYDFDKNPELFIEALRGASVGGVMYGSGHLEGQLRTMVPANVAVAGWVAPADIWNDAFVYVGTSRREAFGRSAVEAAMAGIPVILADSYGCASLLITDAELRTRYVLPIDDVERWRGAVARLSSDESERARLSDHVVMNASRLTIAASVDSIVAELERAT